MLNKAGADSESMMAQYRTMAETAGDDVAAMFLPGTGQEKNVSENAFVCMIERRYLQNKRFNDLSMPPLVFAVFERKRRKRQTTTYTTKSYFTSDVFHFWETQRS